MVQEFDKSLTDYKNYRVISLENSIKVILISDIKPDLHFKKIECDNDSDEENDEKEIQKSAAALCVNVGNFNDPVECPGLAHFLEHMVFMGSAKYPTENDFDSCVSQHGGSCNAFTDVEHTVFHFDSHFENFEIILDKFANFFISPLFLKDSIDREIDAIHSEFEMMYSNDILRIESLLRSLSKNDSPYRKFHCGNRTSLKHIPEEKNIDIYKYLKEFWKNMYLSQWMTLAVQSRDTLDNLETMVRSIFSKIPGSSISKPDTSCFSKPFQTEQFSKFYYVVPVKDIKALKLTWSLPSVISHYKSKPLNIIGHFIGHEGHGSLTAYFRKKNYVIEFQAGHDVMGVDNTSFNSLFSIFIRLTEQGFENITEIIQLIFSYIDLLRKGGIPESLFEEYKQINYNDFLFKETEEPSKVVETLALNLQFYESRHVISGSEVVYEYNPELYSEILSYFTVDNLNVMLLSKCNESKANKLTEWFDVKCSVRDFTNEERNNWSSPIVVSNLHLPEKNKFLASKFDLLEVPNDINETPVDLTSIDFMELTKFGEIWYQLDTKFRTPKAIIDFYMWSKNISENAFNSCLIDLVLYAVNQELSTIAYDASIAGLDYKIMAYSAGIMITINGFNDKISLLFCTIIDFLRDFTLTEEKFFIYVESIRQSYRNMLIKPSKLQSCIHKKIFHPEEWMVSERLKMLKTLSYKDVIKFHNDLFRPMRIRSYFHGNMSKDEAKFCFIYAVENLNLMITKSIPKKFVRQISSGESRIRVLNLNPKDMNTVINITYHIGPGTIETEAVNELLNHVLSEPCFDFLRTKETLGYYVGLHNINNRGILGMSLFVHSQSNKFSIDYCIKKMNIFFETMALELIENLSDDDFNDFKSSFIANKLIEDVQMSVVENRNWAEIFSQEFVFDRNIKHVLVIEDLNKSDLLKFFVDRYLNKSVQRKLIVEVDTKEKMKIDHLEKQEENLFDVNLIFLSFESGKEPVGICDIISDMNLISHQISE